MRQLKRGIAIYLVVLASVLPWASAEALETFEKAGLIADINSSQITISAQAYRLRASTRMVSADPSRQKVTDFQPGDSVYIKGMVLNGVYYIDRLVYVLPDPS